MKLQSGCGAPRQVPIGIKGLPLLDGFAAGLRSLGAADLLPSGLTGVAVTSLYTCSMNKSVVHGPSSSRSFRRSRASGAQP